MLSVQTTTDSTSKYMIIVIQHYLLLCTIGGTGSCVLHFLARIFLFSFRHEYFSKQFLYHSHVHPHPACLVLLHHPSAVPDDLVASLRWITGSFLFPCTLRLSPQLISWRRTDGERVSLVWRAASKSQQKPTNENARVFFYSFPQHGFPCCGRVGSESWWRVRQLLTDWDMSTRVGSSTP